MKKGSVHPSRTAHLSFKRKRPPVRRSYDMFIEHLTRGREQKKQQNPKVNAKFYTSTLLTGAHLEHEFKHAGDTSVQAQYLEQLGGPTLQIAKAYWVDAFCMVPRSSELLSRHKIIP